MGRICVVLGLALLAGCEDDDNGSEDDTRSPAVIAVTIDNQGFQYVSVHLEDWDRRDRVDVSVPLRMAVTVQVTIMDRLRMHVTRDSDGALILDDYWNRSALDSWGDRLTVTVYP